MAFYNLNIVLPTVFKVYPVVAVFELNIILSSCEYTYTVANVENEQQFIECFKYTSIDNVDPIDICAYPSIIITVDDNLLHTKFEPICDPCVNPDIDLQYSSIILNGEEKLI
jgi:hypothetical protein